MVLGVLSRLLPVTTPSRAQLWFETQTVGAEILAAGVRVGMIVIVILLLAARSGLSRELLVVGGFWAIVFPALAAIRLLLGLERKHGRVRMSPYARTRPMGTARMVGVKVLVASCALLVAWATALGAVWLLGNWLGFGDTELRAALADYLPTLPGGMGTAFLLTVLAVHGASLLAWAAGLESLLALDSRRVMKAGLGTVAYGTVVVTLAVQGWLDGELVFYFHLGAIAVGLVALTTHSLSRLRVERILSGAAVGIVVALGLAFALATRDMNLRFLGVDGSGIDEQVVALFLGLLPLGAAAFAPWSLGRLRHQ
jgi:hypothetical protein